MIYKCNSTIYGRPLAVLHDTTETEFATDLRTFPGVRSIVTVPSAEPHTIFSENIDPPQPIFRNLGPGIHMYICSITGNEGMQH